MRTSITQNDGMMQQIIAMIRHNNTLIPYHLMSVGWRRRCVTCCGKAAVGVLHGASPLNRDGTPIWSNGQIPDDLQLCEQSSWPQKGPAMKVAQPWADKRVCCQAVATAGASKRPQAWTKCGSPYKASQSRSFPPGCTSAQECKLECMVKLSSKGVQH